MTYTYDIGMFISIQVYISLALMYIDTWIVIWYVHLNEFLIGHFINTCMVLCDIFHQFISSYLLQCKHHYIGLQKEPRAHVQNRPCKTVGAKKAFVIGFLVHDM